MSIVGEIIAEQHGEEIAKWKAAVQRFLDGDAPTVCMECGVKLASHEGYLECPDCGDRWDPLSGEWSYETLEEDVKELYGEAPVVPPPMSHESKRKQKISFVYGNLKLSNPNITTEMVEDVLKNMEELEK